MRRKTTGPRMTERASCCAVAEVGAAVVVELDGRAGEEVGGRCAVEGSGGRRAGMTGEGGWRVTGIGRVL